jgi:3-oxoacyl-[acyl-carrier-protein] synthase II
LRDIAKISGSNTSRLSRWQRPTLPRSERGCEAGELDVDGMTTALRTASRRVVVTGLGAITPLGIGVKQTWSNLLASKSGIVSTSPLGKEFEALPSRVAGLVPRKSTPIKEPGVVEVKSNEKLTGDGKAGGDTGAEGWDSKDHVAPTELHQSPLFTHYALAASHEALSDAGFENGNGLDAEMTGVGLGSGIGNLEDLYDTSLAYGEKVSHPSLSILRS